MGGDPKAVQLRVILEVDKMHTLQPTGAVSPLPMKIVWAEHPGKLGGVPAYISNISAGACTINITGLS